MIRVAGSGCSILMPRARIAFTVCMQSSLGRNPRSVHTPLARAATITARCEMLLSPGTVISRSIRGARFTRNSIESINRSAVHPGVLGHSYPASAKLLSRRGLRHKKNLVGVRILHFGSGRESFHIDVFTRRIGALHQVRF